MANNIMIALDCGKANTKVAISNKDNSEVTLKSYETKVKEVDLDKETDANLKTIIYENRKFEIGSPDEISNVNSNSKLDDIHKTMALFSIAQNVNDKDNVLVTITCPYDTGMNAKMRNEFAEKILPKGKVDVVLNGKNKSFTISNIIVVPEGIIAQRYLKPNTGHDIGIIDIGGLNSTYVYFDKKGFRHDEMSNFAREGLVKLASKIKLDLGSICDGEFRYDEIIEGIEKGAVYGYEEETASKIKAGLDKILDNIEKDCQSKGWKFRTCDVYFIGGGAISLKDRIKAKFPNAIIPEKPEFINVLGAMTITRMSNGLSSSFSIA